MAPVPMAGAPPPQVNLEAAMPPADDVASTTPAMPPGGANSFVADSTAAERAGAVADGGAAARLIGLNGAVLRIMGRSLIHGDEAAYLRSLLGEHLLPHFEEGGWQLTAPLKTLWAAPPTAAPRVDAVPKSFEESFLASRAEFDASRALSAAERLAAERTAAAQRSVEGTVHAACEGIDANSAAVIAEAVRVASAVRQAGVPAMVNEEIRLAILPNPLAMAEEGMEEDASADAAVDVGDEASTSGAARTPPR